MVSPLALDTLMFVICAVLLTSAIALLIMVSTLAVELIAALVLPARSGALVAEATGSYVIVIPAHDEAGTIEHTLEMLKGEVTGNGRVLVVADNCTDETALVAAAAGATVISRQEPSRRGKGYALNFAVRFLEADPPDVVVILDADCIPDPGTIRKIIAACRQWNCPVQARYELIAPDANAGPIARVGAFAWRVKNILRPTGLTALEVPCLLMGTGMAFPWPTLVKSNLETGHLVEDMVLGLELAARGDGPKFLPEACVRSKLPPSLEGQKSQRTRWETGHLQVIRQYVPWLILRAITRADFRLFALALHAAVPPLVLLVALLVVTTAANGLMALAGGPSLGFKISGFATCAAGIVFAAYWFKAGRDLLNIRELFLLPGYALSKLSIYRRIMSGQGLEWIRSKRD
jgi:cellulose synthase/poly-beta-1,6-N-acetylglucosamine synthase-like glycosyltransferase